MVVFLIYVNSGIFVDIIYGVRYAQSAELIRIMSVGVYFNFCICVAVGILSALNKGKEVFVIVTVSLATTLVLGAELVPRLGLVGAAITVSSIDGVGLLFAIGYLIKYIPGFTLRYSVYPILATVCSVMILEELSRHYSDAVATQVAMGVYGLLLIPPVIKLFNHVMNGYNKR